MAAESPNLPTSLLSNQTNRFLAKYMAGAIERDQNQHSKIKAHKQLLIDDIESAKAYQARILLGLAMLGQFTHENTTIQDDIRNDISSLEGAWKRSILPKMMSFIAYGYSFTERAYQPDESGKLHIGLFKTLDPENYEFEGTPDRVKQVNFQGANDDVEIPYNRGIHFVNESTIVLDNPYGVASCGRALEYYDMERLIWAAWAVAIQRQGTPLIVGKTDTAAVIEVRDEAGNAYIDPATGMPMTIPSRDQMLNALQGIANSGVMTIDREDDVYAVNQEAEPQIFLDSIYECRSNRLGAFLIPPTLFGTSRTGLGDSSIAQTQKQTLLLFVSSQMEEIAETLIDRLMKDLIIFNYGKQSSYGKFPIQTENPLALELLDTISRAVSAGLFTAADDKVIARAKELIGVD